MYCTPQLQPYEPVVADPVYNCVQESIANPRAEMQLRGKRASGAVLFLLACCFFAFAFWISHVHYKAPPCINTGGTVYADSSYTFDGCPLDDTVESVAIEVAPIGGNSSIFTTEILHRSEAGSCNVLVEGSLCNSSTSGECTGTMDVSNLPAENRQFCVRVSCLTKAKNGECPVTARMTYRGGDNQHLRMWKETNWLMLCIALAVFGLLSLFLSCCACMRSAPPDNDHFSREGNDEVFNLRVLES